MGWDLLKPSSLVHLEALWAASTWQSSSVHFGHVLDEQVDTPALRYHTLLL